ncbi:MucR family transcriptional regulator [Gluconacetobacter diazotrophicus]|uniref:MucR family transcriptional regulator n=1 Tax=Gluconacetobacter diazotrophicus TaxID=33996 RepID=UPI00217F470A|nr:MucR family transcriptional regulator [Gluconacetobacter diazotrophicus]
MTSQLKVLTARIATAYVAHTQTAPIELPGLLTSIYDALACVSTIPDTPDRPEAPTPAVPPKRSVFPDYIVCLEDGRQFKTLKRHLMSAYNLTPDQYRARWNLPADYPMVAPNYGLHRAKLAKAFGLGRTDVPPVEAPPEIVEGVVVTRVPAARRGRRRRA